MVNMNQLTPQQIQAAKQAGFTDQELEIYLPKLGFAAPKTLGGFGRNLTRSTGNLIGNTVEGIANIVNPNIEQNTIAQIGRLALGIVDSVLPGEQGNEQYAQALGQYFADRYGGLDNIMETFYQDPAGFIDDAAMILTAGGAAATKVGKLGGLNKIASVGQDVARIGNLADPIQMMGRTAGKGMDIASDATRGMQRAMGSQMENLGRRFVTGGLGNPTKQTDRTVDVMLRYPELLERDPGMAKQVSQGLGRQYDEIAASTQFDPAKLLGDIDAEIAKLNNPMALQSSTNQAKLEQLTFRRQQLVEALGIDPNAIPPQMGTSSLIDWRRNALDPDIPANQYNIPFDQSNRVGADKSFRDIIRRNINASDQSGQLENLGLDIQTTKKLTPIFEASEKRALNRQPINFSKFGLATVGAVLGGAPAAIGGFIAEQAINSPKNTGKIASTLIETGKNLKTKKIKKPTLPSPFRKIGMSAYQTSRVLRGREGNQPQQQQEMQSELQSRRDVLKQGQSQEVPKMSSTGDISIDSPYDDPFKKIKKQYKIY